MIRKILCPISLKNSIKYAIRWALKKQSLAWKKGIHKMKAWESILFKVSLQASKVDSCNYKVWFSRWWKKVRLVSIRAEEIVNTNRVLSEEMLNKIKRSGQNKVFKIWILETKDLWTCSNKWWQLIPRVLSHWRTLKFKKIKIFRKNKNCWMIW